MNHLDTGSCLTDSLRRVKIFPDSYLFQTDELILTDSDELVYFQLSGSFRYELFSFVIMQIYAKCVLEYPV